MTAALFPHQNIRPIQDMLIKSIQETIEQKTSLVVHAPTGLGKTAAALSPAVHAALKEKLTVFFLTSRHTQHKIVIDTLQALRDQGSAVTVASIIGKRWFCLQPGVEGLRSREFYEYCRAMVEDGKCEFYENFKDGEKLSASTRLVLHQLNKVAATEDIIRAAREYKLCPYELALQHAKHAEVIIADYSYVFNPTIRVAFLKKIEKDLDRSIIVVDEAHNLPDRVKESQSDVLTSNILARAITEAKKFQYDDIAAWLKQLEDVLSAFEQKLLHRTSNEFEGKTDVKTDEMYVEKETFLEAVGAICPYADFVEQLFAASNVIREKNRQSYVGAIAGFLTSWQGSDEGFTRIFSVQETPYGKTVVLSYKCLDPSLVTKDVFSQAHASILMSGTLTPTFMYQALLGLDGREEVFPSPFPQKNQLNLIIPKTTTKFSGRTAEQYKDIAAVVHQVTACVPGNVAIFFPSYYLLNRVYDHFMPLTKKTCFVEKPLMKKEEKLAFLEKFKTYKNAGAVLLGVITGSYGEGIDLPGDLLNGVVVVGLPLQKPTLEIKALIEYYDKKFGKGWDYGYVFPAFNKTLQSAGRCIRSETDKGVIVFLDERYAWPQYMKLFPQDKEVKVTMLYERMIRDFFAQ